MRPASISEAAHANHGNPSGWAGRGGWACLAGLTGWGGWAKKLKVTQRDKSPPNNNKNFSKTRPALLVKNLSVAILGWTELAKYRILQEEQKTNTAPF